MTPSTDALCLPARRGGGGSAIRSTAGETAEPTYSQRTFFRYRYSTAQTTTTVPISTA
jgi:hypothetical protein